MAFTVLCALSLRCCWRCCASTLVGNEMHKGTSCSNSCNHMFSISLITGFSLILRGKFKPKHKNDKKTPTQTKLTSQTNTNKTNQTNTPPKKQTPIILESFCHVSRQQCCAKQRWWWSTHKPEHAHQEVAFLLSCLRAILGKAS